MGFLKTAREIALEKTSSDKLNSQEIADIKQHTKIDTILAKYYKDQIEPDQLWHHLKEIPEKYFGQVQNNFLRSFTFQSNPYDADKRKRGLLAVENLKKINRSSDIENYFDQLIQVQKDFQDEVDRLIEYVKEDLEKNPEKRLQTFQQGNQIIIKELTVEEILEQDKGLKQKLNQIEKKYSTKFNQLKEKMAILLNKTEE
ncbi:MAG TPA: hypothetical protein PLT58_00650 [Atribacterota bacterium]|nr:hypothetical protein [Atribacterota bacterium]